jgi:hypothetical protein
LHEYLNTCSKFISDNYYLHEHIKLYTLSIVSMYCLSLKYLTIILSFVSFLHIIKVSNMSPCSISQTFNSFRVLYNKNTNIFFVW